MSQNTFNEIKVFIRLFFFATLHDTFDCKWRLLFEKLFLSSISNKFAFWPCKVSVQKSYEMFKPFLNKIKILRGSNTCSNFFYLTTELSDIWHPHKE